jgi:hypothetical protein
VNGQNGPGVTPILDRASTTLAQLSALATKVLNEHTHDHGLCAICGSAWPCKRVKVAAHNAELTS